MGIKNYLKSIIAAAITASAIVSGSVSAESFTNYTGDVYYFFTLQDGYTFVIIETAEENVAGYYIGTNSAMATVIDNAKRFNQSITVSIDNTTNLIKGVRWEAIILTGKTR